MKHLLAASSVLIGVLFCRSVFAEIKTHSFILPDHGDTLKPIIRFKSQFHVTVIYDKKTNDTTTIKHNALIGISEAHITTNGSYANSTDIVLMGKWFNHTEPRDFTFQLTFYFSRTRDSDSFVLEYATFDFNFDPHYFPNATVANSSTNSSLIPMHLEIPYFFNGSSEFRNDTELIFNGTDDSFYPTVLSLKHTQIVICNVGDNKCLLPLTTTVPVTTTPSNSKTKGLATGTIVGIVVGTIVTVGVFMIPLVLYIYRRRHQVDGFETLQEDSQNP